MNRTTPPSEPPQGLDQTGDRQVGGPVAIAWREGTLTRAKELESLCAWVLVQGRREDCDVLAHAVSCHLAAAREAAVGAPAQPRRWRSSLFRDASLRERAMSNLDAAEAHILNIAPAEYVLGQVPGVLRHVREHLVPGNPQRLELERLARRLGVGDAHHPLPSAGPDRGAGAAGPRRARRTRPVAAPPEERPERAARKALVEEERGRIVTALRAASSAALREQVRVRNFRNVIVATTVVMTGLAIVIGIAGWRSPTMMPLCFAPEESGTAVVVCPTAQSEPFPTSRQGGTTTSGTPDAVAAARDIDDAVKGTVTPRDLLVVELIGLTAAAVSAAAAIRGIRGSSERQGLPVALAALKLPTGAITAFLGLLLLRGQFIPGLSALDTSAQILAWALVFGYAQQLFTRLVDRQGHTVLESVRGADKAPATEVPL